MKIKKIKKTRPGITLIETLIYCVMLGLFLGSITIYAWDILEGKIKNDSQAEVNDNAAIAMDEISGAIKNAKNIVSPAQGASANSLVLNMPNNSQNTFTISNGRLQVTNSVMNQVNTDVMLLTDVSGSMSGSSLTAEKSAATSFVNNLNTTYDKIGLISFNTNVVTLQHLTNNFTSVKTAINNLSASGDTNFQPALVSATSEFNGGNHRSNATKTIVFISDGCPSDPGDSHCYAPWITQSKAAADAAKASGITIYTIGLGLTADLPAIDVPIARGVLQYMASSTGGTNDHYFEAPTSGSLANIYNQIAFILTTSTAQNLTSSIVASQLTQLNFTNVSNAGTAGCIRVQLQISRSNSAGSSDYNANMILDDSISLKPN